MKNSIFFIILPFFNDFCTKRDKKIKIFAFIAP